MSISFLKHSGIICWSTTFQRIWNEWFLISLLKAVYEYCFAQFKNRFMSSIKSSSSLNFFMGFSLQTPIMYLANWFVHSSCGNVSDIIFNTCLTISQFLTFHNLFLTNLAFRVLNLLLMCRRMVLMLDFNATSLRFCFGSELVHWLYGVLIHNLSIPESRVFEICFQSHI